MFDRLSQASFHLSTVIEVPPKNPHRVSEQRLSWEFENESQTLQYTVQRIHCTVIRFHAAEPLVAESEISRSHYLLHYKLAQSLVGGCQEVLFFESEIIAEDIHHSFCEFPHSQPFGIMLKRPFLLVGSTAAKKVVVVDYLSEPDTLEEEMLHYV